MALLGLIHCTATYVPAEECVLVLGDNSESGGLNPWASALRVVHFLGAKVFEGDDEPHKFSRHYTIRPARFPQDAGVVQDILSKHASNLGTAASHDAVDTTTTMADDGHILLLCAILVDGGDDHDSVPERMKRVPEEKRHPNPIPEGRGGISTTKGFYVLFEDLPESVLEENVVGFVRTRPSKNDLQNNPTEPDTQSSTHNEAHDPGSYEAVPGSDDDKKLPVEGVKLDCELDQLYVNRIHHKSLGYALVDTMIVHMKNHGYTTMTLNLSKGVEGLEYAKEIFEQAGPEPTNVFAYDGYIVRDESGEILKSPNPTAVETITTNKDKNRGEAADVVLRIILDRWPGPLKVKDSTTLHQWKEAAPEPEPEVAPEAQGDVIEPAKCNPYHYSPLDEDAQEFRVMTLLPGLPDAEIRVSLKICQLYRPRDSRIPRFEALSYSWGPTDDLRPVFAGRYNRTISVTRDLAEALLHLRDVDKPRHLWIDAICVNQADLHERSSQINRMAEIYRMAERVIVWLGPCTAQRLQAMIVLTVIGSTVDVQWFTHSMARRTDHSDVAREFKEGFMRDHKNLDVGFPFDAKQTESLLDLLSRPWFERFWVWQEINLQHERAIVQCGHEWMQWKHLSSAIFLIATKNFPSLAYVQPKNKKSLGWKVQAAYRVCDDGVEDCRSIFEHRRFAKCSDPRDRVYSLLSLFAQVEPDLHITPDYTKTVYEVYQDATLRILMDLGRSDILACVELREDDEPGMAGRWSSWVPDWRRPRRTWPIVYALAAHTSRVEISHHGQAIRLAGVPVAEISHLYPFDPPAFHPLGLSETNLTDQEQCEATRKNLLRVARHFFREQHQPSAPDIGSFCRAIVAGEDADQFIPDEREVEEDLPVNGAQYVSFRAMEQIMQRLLDGGDPSATGPSPHEEEERILAHVLVYCEGRSLFRLPNGNFGLAPNTAQEGDVVVVLLGCDSPLVLRPTSTPTPAPASPTTFQQYRIVGEAYCDGYMFGEALLGSPAPIRLPIGAYEAASTPFIKKAFKDGTARLDDKRLGDMPAGWEMIWEGPVVGERVTRYRNNQLGTAVLSKNDPRLFSLELRKRGIDVQTFEII